MNRNAQVTSYIESKEPRQKEILSTLRELIFRVIPEVEEAFKWSRPVYSFNGPLAYLVANKNHVNLGFYRGGITS